MGEGIFSARDKFLHLVLGTWFIINYNKAKNSLKCFFRYTWTSLDVAFHGRSVRSKSITVCSSACRGRISASPHPRLYAASTSVWTLTVRSPIRVITIYYVEATNQINQLSQFSGLLAYYLQVNNFSGYFPKSLRNVGWGSRWHSQRSCKTKMLNFTQFSKSITVVEQNKCRCTYVALVATNSKQRGYPLLEI